MQLPLNLLEIFAAVYEHRGISRAAARLSVSQPTISGHLKALEEHAGTKLFDRLPRRLIPTRAGERLYTHVRAILAQREAAVRELNGLNDRMEGELVVHSSSIPGDYMLPGLVKSFRGQYPGARIELRISDSVEVCQTMLKGEAELGFVGASVDAVGLHFQMVASDELALVVPNDSEWQGIDRISLERLLQVSFLARERGSGTRLAFEHALGRPVGDLNVVATFPSTNALKEAIKVGTGVSVLSLWAVRSEIAAAVLKTVAIEGVLPIERTFFVVTHKRRTRSPLADAFLHCALASSAAAGPTTANAPVPTSPPPPPRRRTS